MLRYGHGHSAGLGFLLALALERHALVFALLVFAAGVVAGRCWLAWLRLARLLSRNLEARTRNLRRRDRGEIPF